jgi:hypothetical protein
MTAPAAAYTLIEKEARIIALDAQGVEICGARQPFGHDEWVVYVSVRVTPNLHQVLATTKAHATEHVRMIAELFTRSTAA